MAALNVFFPDAEISRVDSLAVFGLAVALTAWMWRLAAWDDGTGVVVRNWFRTKYIPWHEVENLALVKRRGLRNSWISVAVRHQGGQTRISAMIAVSDTGTAKLVAELGDLARKHKLKLNGVPSSRFNTFDWPDGLWD